MGALKYSDSLLKKLNEGILFSSGDTEEVEIRGNSIWVVEVLASVKVYSLLQLIRRRMVEIIKENGGELGGEPLNGVVIDFFLWGYAKEHSKEMEDIPIHKVRSIYY